MKKIGVNFMLPLFLALGFAACGPARNSDPGTLTITTSGAGQGGDGTREGGDGCEQSFGRKLNEAITFLSLSRVMDGVEEAKALEELIDYDSAKGEYKFLRSLDIRCDDKEIRIGGELKTAETISLPPAPNGGKIFLVHVNISRWFGSPKFEQISIAAHEVLVMKKLERTNDYHLSSKLLQRLPVISNKTLRKMECTKRMANSGRYANFVVERASESPADLRYSAGIHVSEQPMAGGSQLDNIQISPGFSCANYAFEKTGLQCSAGAYGLSSYRDTKLVPFAGEAFPVSTYVVDLTLPGMDSRSMQALGDIIRGIEGAEISPENHITIPFTYWWDDLESGDIGKKLNSFCRADYDHLDHP